MTIQNNVKHLYKKMYPSMSIEKIQGLVFEFDKFSLEQGITLESSNRHKYLRGWLMMAEFNASKLAESEKDLAYYKAIYAPLIDGAARDTTRINKLEEKLKIAVEALDEIGNGCDCYPAETAREALAKIK